MHVVKQWPLRLTTLSFRQRLVLVLLSFLICLFLYGLTSSLVYNGSILVIPMILTAWLFKYRGVLANTVASTVSVLIINSLVFPRIFWSPPVLLMTLVGLAAGTFIGLVISVLRHVVDMVEASRQQVVEAEQAKVRAYEQQRKAQEAERHMALAYEHQLLLNQEKDLFLAHVNHELCTPLTAVSGYLELLLMYGKNLDEGKKTGYLQQAFNGCRELEQLVANLLDSAQITAQGITPSCEQIVVRQVAQEVLSLFDPHQTLEYTLSVEIPETVTVWADRQFLRQILRNLLSNAFKYSAKQTTILLRTAPYAPSETGMPQVCLSVQDRGGGIPLAEMSTIFEKFTRLKRDMTGTIRGTGLGLYICKQLVEAMGGRIWAESSGQVGKGSCISFVLPCLKPHMAPLH